MHTSLHDAYMDIGEKLRPSNVIGVSTRINGDALYGKSLRNPYMVVGEKNNKSNIGVSTRIDRDTLYRKPLRNTYHVTDYQRLFFMVKDNECFKLDFFKYENEKKTLQSWLDKMNIDTYIEDSNLNVNEYEMDELKFMFGESYDIEYLPECKKKIDKEQTKKEKDKKTENENDKKTENENDKKTENENDEKIEKDNDEKTETEKTGLINPEDIGSDDPFMMPFMMVEQETTEFDLIEQKTKVDHPKRISLSYPLTLISPEVIESIYPIGQKPSFDHPEHIDPTNFFKIKINSTDHLDHIEGVSPDDVFMKYIRDTMNYANLKQDIKRAEQSVRCMVFNKPIIEPKNETKSESKCEIPTESHKNIGSSRISTSIIPYDPHGYDNYSFLDTTTKNSWLCSSNGNWENGDWDYKDSYHCRYDTDSLVSEMKTQTLEKSVMLVYNEEYLYSFVIEDPNNVEKYILDNKKYGFSVGHQFNIKKDDYILTVVMKLFDDKNYNDVGEIRQNLETIIQITDKINDTTSNDIEKNNITDYINNTFTITENTEDRLKSSDLCVMVENYMMSFKNEFSKGDSSLKNKLSKYLLELGLKKKRYSDGFYYYGLKKNKQTYDNEKLSDINALEKLELDRQTELTNIQQNRPTYGINQYMNEEQKNKQETLIPYRNNDLTKLFMNG